MMGSDGGWKDEWKPNGVVFGVNKSWLVTCEGGKHLCISPNLRTHYKDMCDELFRHFKGSDTPCGVRTFLRLLMNCVLQCVLTREFAV